MMNVFKIFTRNYLELIQICPQGFILSKICNSDWSLHNHQEAEDYQNKTPSPGPLDGGLFPNVLKHV